jgi:hypothetical protein
MKDEWLLSVIREAEEFVKLHTLHDLLPLIQQAYLAAHIELNLPAPIDIQRFRLSRQGFIKGAARSN